MIYAPPKKRLIKPRRKHKRFVVDPSLLNVQLYGGNPLLVGSQPAVDPNCCCEHDTCPFLLLAIARQKTNAGSANLTLNRGTTFSYDFPGDTNTNVASTCSGRCWITVPAPTGTDPPPINLCDIHGYYGGTGVKLFCCGTQLDFDCDGDGLPDPGYGNWPAAGYDVTTLNGVYAHDCPIMEKQSNSSPCNVPGDGGLIQDVGDCMSDVDIVYIPGASSFICTDGSIFSGCNRLYGDVTLTGTYGSRIIAIQMWPIIKVSGVWYLLDLSHTEPSCAGGGTHVGWILSGQFDTNGTFFHSFVPDGCGYTP
jgi:hypothetical protein